NYFGVAVSFLLEFIIITLQTKTMKDIVDLIARILISFIFLFEAYDYIRNFEETKMAMANYGISWQPNSLLVGAIMLLILGGMMVLSGYRSGLGATLLLFYWIPVTFIMHSFWNDPEATRQLAEMHFMKNLAIIGGLLTVLVNGSGRYSIRRLFATARVPGA
ncbi:MAG: DoxX family protein, partial [Saprospiraceae bacterium]